VHPLRGQGSIRLWPHSSNLLQLWESKQALVERPDLGEDECGECGGRV
jgi:hypothetical protein